MNYLITGASKGIGRALAGFAIADGHNVAGLSRTKPEGPFEFDWYEVDITDENSVKRAIQAIRGKWGKIDVLINNAGIASMNHSLLTPTATFQKILNVNTLGTFIISREVAKWMQRIRGGSIINFSTIAVPLAVEGEAAYAASKAGIELLTKVMSKELEPLGIRVNCIGPSVVSTSLTKAVPKEKLEALIGSQTIKREATALDVYNVVKFFASENSGMITGQTIYLGGI